MNHHPISSIIKWDESIVVSQKRQNYNEFSIPRNNLIAHFKSLIPLTLNRMKYCERIQLNN